MVGVEQWAEIRRMYFVGRLSIKPDSETAGPLLAQLDMEMLEPPAS